MTSDRLAVIDLGSNTFHLLVCEVNVDGSWTVIYKERIYVKLAAGGLDFIDEGSIQRGLEAMIHFAEKIKEFGVQNVRSIGTAALREAANGSAVADLFTSGSGLAIEIIGGEAEADFILAGIKSCIPPLDRPGLIMDIGGGSVEFILFRDDVILFKGSFKLGVAELFRKFHHQDPASEREIQELEQYIDAQLNPMIGIIRQSGAYDLIGASGSFEVLNDVLPRVNSSTHWSELEVLGFKNSLDEVILMNLKSRLGVPEIPKERADFIVVAYVLIRYVILRIPPSKLYYCDYALKEGVLEEMLRLK